MAVKQSKPKTSKKQKPEKKNSPPKKRKPVPSKTNNNNVRTTQQGLVNQAAKTGNQTTVVRINNALAKASARVNRRYAGISKPPIQYAQPLIGIAPAFNIQFPSMGANYDNGMREVNGMRNDIINEFHRLNPHAAYAPPPPPQAPPGAGAVAAAPPPMSVHPDAVYEEPALAPEGPAAPSNAGSVGGGGSAAMSIDSEHTAPVAHEAEHTAPVAPEAPGAPEAPATEAPQDPIRVGDNGDMPAAEQLFPATPEPVVTPPPDEILHGERRNPRGREEIIPDQAQIGNLEEEERPLARRQTTVSATTLAWQEHQARQTRQDRGLSPQSPQPIHLGDFTFTVGRRGNGINNRPSSLPTPQTEPQSGFLFDQNNQQNMLEHMSNNGAGATGTIPELPEVPEIFFTFDSSNFPGYLNSGPPTSPASIAFIDDYLNSPTSPQALLTFDGQSPDVPEPTTAPQDNQDSQVVPGLSEVAAVNVASTGMTTGTTPKPRSPRRSRSPPSPNRLIAPNTPAGGIARPPYDSTRAARSQTPDVRAEEEDVNALPTKGPLGIRKNTIAAKKRANVLEKARKTARSQSPTASVKTVQRAQRSTRKNIPELPEPGAMTISPDSSAQRKQMPTDEEETETESDEAIRRRHRSNSANQSSSSEQNSDQGPSQPKRPVGRSAVKKALAQEAYRKVYDDAPTKSQIVSRRDRPQGVGPVEGFQKYIKMRNEAEGVVLIKATRDAALSDLFANDPSARKLSVKDLVDKYNNNPNHADIPLTPSMARHYNAEYKKRKETEPASNPRSNPKDQTKKKRKK
jgi:hypothetical protein